MAELDKLQATENMVEKKQQDAEALYDSATNAADNNDWLNEMQAKLNAVPAKKVEQPQVQPTNSAWLEEQQKKLDAAPVKQSGSTAPSVTTGTSGEPKKPKAEQNGPASIEIDYDTLFNSPQVDLSDPADKAAWDEAEKKAKADWEEEKSSQVKEIPGGVTETPSQSATVRVAPRDTQAAPRFARQDTWLWTKTIKDIDTNSDLYKDGLNANKYGNLLDKRELAAVQSNTDSNDLLRQAREIHARWPERNNSAQYEHDVQLLAAIDNQRVALEYGYANSADMERHIGDAQYKMYADAFRKDNKYFSFYDDMRKNGIDLEVWNPFDAALPESVEEARKKDKAEGKDWNDNYYYHMALNDKDFRGRLQAWSLAYGKQKNMEMAAAKNHAAGLADRRHSAFVEKEADRIANSWWGVPYEGWLNSGLGEVTSTIMRGWDDKGVDMMYEISDRAMQKMSSGKAAFTGVVSLGFDVAPMAIGSGVAGWAVRGLSSTMELGPVATRVLVGGLGFANYEASKAILDSTSHGRPLEGAEVVAGFFRGMALGGSIAYASSVIGGAFSKASEKVGGNAFQRAGRAANNWLATTRGGNYTMRALGKGAEFGIFAGSEIIGELVQGKSLKDIDYEAIALNNGAMIISMSLGHHLASSVTGKTGFGRQISKGQVKRMRDLGYNALADEMETFNNNGFRNKPFGGYSEAAQKELAALRDSMKPGGTTNWSDYAAAMLPTGSFVTQPGVNSASLEKINGRYVIISKDQNGIEIGRQSYKKESEARKDYDYLKKAVAHNSERANEESFGMQRASHIQAEAARAVADVLNERAGVPAYNEDGTPNPNYMGRTASDLNRAFERISKIPAGKRTAEDNELMDMFEQEMERIDKSAVTTADMKRVVCEQYGMTEEAFDKAWETDADKRTANEKKACDAYNSILSRPYEINTGRKTGEAVLSDGKTVEVVSRIEYDENGNPRPQNIYYKGEDGKIYQAPAENVKSVTETLDTGAAIDKISQDNQDARYNALVEQNREALASYSDNQIMEEAFTMMHAIDSGADTDGSLTIRMNILLGEYGRREAEKFNSASDREKAVMLVEERLPDASEEQKADISAYYAEHPLELQTAIRYPEIHNSEIKALVDSKGIKESVGWRREYDRYVADEEAFRKDFKKAFSREATAEPYGFEREKADTEETPSAATEPQETSARTEEGELPSIEETIEWMFPYASAEDKARYVAQYTEHPEEIEKSRRNLAVMRSNQQPQSGRERVPTSEPQAQSTETATKTPNELPKPENEIRPAEVETETELLSDDDFFNSHIDTLDENAVALALKIPKGPQRDRFLLKELIKKNPWLETEYTAIIERRNAEDNIESSEDDATRFAALLNIYGGQAFNSAGISEARKTLEKIIKTGHGYLSNDEKGALEALRKFWDKLGYEVTYAHEERVSKGNIGNGLSYGIREKADNSQPKDRIDELLDAMGFKGDERAEQRAFYADKDNAEQFEKDYKDFVGKEVPQPKEEVKVEEKKDDVVDDSQQGPESKEPEIVDDINAPMPTKTVKGKQKVDYSKTTPRRGYHNIYNERGLSTESADRIVKNSIKAAEDAIKAHAKKKPKEGTAEDIDEWMEQNAAWEQENARLEAEKKYWEEVQSISDLTKDIKEIEDAKSFTSRRDVFNKMRSKYATDPAMRAYSEVRNFVPQNLYDACVHYLTSGVRFVWDAEGARRGLQQQTGWGEAERKRLIAMLSKDGVTPEKAVHEIVDAYGEDLGIDLSMSQDILNTLLDAISSTGSVGAAHDYIRTRLLEQMRNELTRRIEGEARDTYDTDADRYYDEQVQQYRDEHPELKGATDEEVIAAMERERNKSEEQNENPPATEQQPNDTVPNETGINDEFFEGSGEGEYAPFRDGEGDAGEETQDTPEKEAENVVVDSSKIKLPTNRKEAIAAVAAMNRPFVNEDQNKEILVSNTAIRHASTQDKEHNFVDVRCMGIIDKIIKNAVKIGEIPVKEKEKGHTHKVEVYYCPVNIDGVQHSARLIVKQYENRGFVLDDFQLYDLGTKQQKTGNQTQGTGTNALTPLQLPVSRYKVKDLIHSTQEEDRKLLNIGSNEETLFRTSEELDKEYPTWLSGQTTDSGQHTTQITSTVKSYNRIGDWMKKNGMEGASVLDASSGLGVGTQSLREQGFNVDDVEPYPSKDREAPTYSKYEDIDKEYDVVISNAVLNVIPDDWRADVLKSMADKLKVGGKLIINVRDAKSIENQKQKIELDSPSEILVTDSKGNIRAYQKGFTKKELQDWVKSELGEGWEVDIANENNSGLKSGVAVVVTKGENAAPVRYRTFEPIGERGVKKVTQVREPEYREATDYFGKPTTIQTRSAEYKVEGMDDTFRSVEEAADAVRRRNPDYCVYIDNEGNIRLEAWSNLLPEGVKPNSFAKVIAMSGGDMSNSMKKRIANYAKREMDQARKEAETLTQQLGLDVEFHDDPSEFTGRKAKAKGWYDPKTGKIHVVMGNHSGVGDVMATMLHEGVAHHGLRKMFGNDFDTFLDNVHDNVGEEIRAEIDGRIDKMRAADEKNGETHSDDYYRRAATEEYIAELSEDGLYNAEKNSSYAMRAWEWIKENFLNMLRKAGYKGEISDDELRYILWKSHQNLRQSAVEMAKDAVLKEKAGIKDYVEEGEPVRTAAERGEQMSLFPKNEATRSLGGARELSDADLLAEIGKDRYDVRSTYTDEYDRRHKREHNETYDSTTKMLEEGITTIEQAGEMLIDAAYDLRNNYTSKERAVSKARFEAIQDYYFNKEAELDKARFDFFMEHEKELKERFGEDYFEDENVDKLMAEYGMAVGEPRVPYGTAAEARKILTEDVRYRDGEEGPARDYAAEMRELMRRRLRGEDVAAELELLRADRRAAEAARSAESAPATSTGGAGNGEPPIEPPTPPAPPTPEPAPELPPTEYDRPMTAIEQAQAAAIKAVADTKASLEQRNAARRELTASLRNIHKAMRIQKEYDRATVENVVSLCKMMVQSGLIDRRYISNLTPLFTKLKDSTGKEDLTSTANDIMDVMLKSQERSVRNEIAKLLSTKGVKVDKNGVVTQAGLDIRGQRTLQSLNENFGKSVEEIDRRITQLEDLRGRIPENSEERLNEVDDKIQGALLAKQYIETAKNHEENITAAEDELAEIKAQYKDGELGLKEYTEQKHALEAQIRSYRMSHADAMWDYVNAMRGIVAEGRSRAKDFLEAQKAHKNEIRHNAYSDMVGTPQYTQSRPDRLAKISNSSISKAISASLYTFDEMLRTLGRKHANGEGYLYERFGRGWVDARDREIIDYWADRDALDAKTQELFGVKHFANLIDAIRKMPKMDVPYKDGGDIINHTLDQAQLMYIYMVNKMEDGVVKLRRMGISEEKVDMIKNFLNPKLVELADWLQGDFLPSKREGYNEVHRRMFGADMDMVENYVPLRIDKGGLGEKVDINNGQNEPSLASTVTGGIIKRTHNTMPIDIMGTNAIDMILDHIDEMNHWKNFAEWNRDVNTLLSDRTFRNKVKNTTTIYGSGDALWKRLKDVFFIAGGTYKPQGGDFDKLIVGIAKNVSAAKVSMRVFTATKQLLSLPVFAANCNVGYMVKNMARPAGSWNWCMENLPSFKQRWKSRIAGDTRLEDTDIDWKYQHKKWVEKASKWGLSPNAFVDAMTVAVGARSVYEQRYKRYRKDGYDDVTADRRARQDATVAFNQTQQSSEKMFVAPMQVDRGGFAVGASLFRSASMGYERQLVAGVRNLKHLMGKESVVDEDGNVSRVSYKEASIDFMTKQMTRNGIPETQAKANAERIYRRSKWRNALKVAMFSNVAQFAWNIGGKLPYMAAMGFLAAFGSDEEKRKALANAWDTTKEAAIHALACGWFEGLPFGNIVSEGVNNEINKENFFKYSPDLLPIFGDIEDVGNHFDGKNKLRGATDLVNLGAQIFIGVNPQTFTDAITGIVDSCFEADKKDEMSFGTAKEAMLIIMRIMQVPQSQLDKLYIDEIGMTAGEAQKLTPEQVARRYAYMKAHREAPALWWTYNQEKKDELIKEYEKNFNKKLNEDVKEAGGTAEDYHDLAESSTTEKGVKKWRQKEIDALSARGPEALKKAYDTERAKGAEADYKYMRSLMSRYQKDEYGEEKMPADKDAAYEAAHGEDLEKQAEKIGRDLGFEAQDSFYQMSQTKTKNSSANNKTIDEFHKLGGSFKYSEDGEFLDMEEYNIKLPVKDKAKRAKALKFVEDHKPELQRIYRNGWRMQRIKALYKQMEDAETKMKARLTPYSEEGDMGPIGYARMRTGAYQEIERILGDEAKEDDRKSKK